MPVIDRPVQFRVARLQRCLTQAQLAKHLGVTQQTIHRWEAGKVTPRPAAMARLLAALFGGLDRIDHE